MMGLSTLAPRRATTAMRLLRIGLSHLSVSRVSSWIFVGDRLRRSWPRVQIAKAAITGDHVRDAFFYRAVLAVPIHVALPDIDYCAPGGITICSAGRGSEPRRCRKGSDANCQFRKSFRHDDPSLVFYVFLDNTAAEK
jgi:hypothetical protein